MQHGGDNDDDEEEEEMEVVADICCSKKGRDPSVITNAKMFRPNGRECRSELPALEGALPEVR